MPRGYTTAEEIAHARDSAAEAVLVLSRATMAAAEAVRTAVVDFGVSREELADIAGMPVAEIVALTPGVESRAQELRIQRERAEERVVEARRAVRDEAVRRVAEGESEASVARILGVGRRTLREWLGK